MKRLTPWLLLVCLLFAPSAFAVQSVGNGNTSCPVVGSGTFANKPSGVSACSQYFATDLGTNGVMIVYSGTVWKPLGGVAIIAQSGATSSTLTGTVSETNIASVTIPAGLLSANGGLEISSQWKTNSGTANAKTAIIRLDTSVQTSGTNTVFNVQDASSTNNGISGQMYVLNKNSVSSQTIIGLLLNSYGTSGVQTISINTAVQTVLSFNGLLANSGDSLILFGYTVKWMEP